MTNQSFAPIVLLKLAQIPESCGDNFRSVSNRFSSVAPAEQMIERSIEFYPRHPGHQAKISEYPLFARINGLLPERGFFDVREIQIENSWLGDRGLSEEWKGTSDRGELREAHLEEV